jgi:hypothetical protein
VRTKFERSFAYSTDADLEYETYMRDGVPVSAPFVEYLSKRQKEIGYNPINYSYNGLVAETCKRTGIPYADVVLVISTFFDIVREALVKGFKVTMPNLFTMFLIPSITPKITCGRLRDKPNPNTVSVRCVVKMHGYFSTYIKENPVSLFKSYIMNTVSKGHSIINYILHRQSINGKYSFPIMGTANKISYKGLAPVPNELREVLKIVKTANSNLEAFVRKAITRKQYAKKKINTKLLRIPLIPVSRACLRYDYYLKIERPRIRALSLQEETLLRDPSLSFDNAGSLIPSYADIISESDTDAITDSMRRGNSDPLSDVDIAMTNLLEEVDEEIEDEVLKDLLDRECIF